MDKIDFVQLAWMILDQYAEVDDEGNQTFLYEDEFILINSDLPYATIEITRKGIDDPERPHLRVDNPVTAVEKTDGTKTPEIIRHHGEHTILVSHMLYLIEICDKYREFYFEMLKKYPDIVVKFGV